MFVEKPESLRSISCLYLLPMSLYCIPTVYIYMDIYLKNSRAKQYIIVWGLIDQARTLPKRMRRWMTRFLGSRK